LAQHLTKVHCVDGFFDFGCCFLQELDFLTFQGTDVGFFRISDVVGFLDNFLLIFPFDLDWLFYLVLFFGFL
jgi:hypothetical protein